MAQAGSSCQAKKKLRFSLPDAAPDTADAIETEVADSQEPESMPAISSAWDNLDIEQSQFDPIALAKSLAQSDMLDDDEDETLGKGKAKME